LLEGEVDAMQGSHTRWVCEHAVVEPNAQLDLTQGSKSRSME